MTRLTYRAANRSSIVTPQPPGSAWLGPIGHGLAMSNSRNSNTMATDQCQVDSPKKNHHSGIVPFVKYSDETQPAKQSGTATISSMTIEPGSRRPRIVSARPQNQTDATLSNNSDPTKNAKLPGNSSRMNSGKPSNVPTVPGATDERPVPSPCAMRRISLSTGQQSLRYTSRFFQRYRNPERAVSATATHFEISATHQAHAWPAISNANS